MSYDKDGKRTVIKEIHAKDGLPHTHLGAKEPRPTHGGKPVADELNGAQPVAAFTANPAVQTELDTNPQPAISATKPKEKLEYVVVIRALAMIIVIAEHVIYPQIELFTSITLSDWWIASFMYLIGKTGSPLFTMISGLLLLHPSKADQPVGVFFKKRLVKVFIPFAAWTGIYLAYRIYWNGENLQWDAIKYLLISGPVYGHLWFLQMIIGLYLVTPILRVYIKGASRSNLTYFLIVWYCMTSLFPVIERMIDVRIGIYLYVATGYVGFFVLGIYLRDITLKGKYLHMGIWGIGIFWLLSQFLSHEATILKNGGFDHFYSFNTSFNIVPLSILCFLVLKSIDWQAVYKASPAFKWVIKQISIASLGIYCVHQLVIDELRKGVFDFVLDETTWHFFISVPVVTAVVMIISAMVALGLKKIPVVHNIVP